MRIGLNTPWLVKSDGRVVGPYLEKQIADLLREKIIRPIDEVARPCGRWNFIRDEPSFAKITEEIRIRSLKNIDDSTTKSAEVSEVTRTETFSLTEPDELTQEITHFPASQSSAQDVLFHSIEDQNRTNSRTSGETFTHEGDLLVKLRANQTTRWVWAATSVVILLTLGFVVFRQFIAIPIQNKSILDQSTTAGIEALESGEYSTAADLFNHAYALDPNDKSIYLYLGILQIQIENQAFKGRQLLEQLKADGTRDLKQIMTGIGLAFLKESEPKKAEMAFKLALEIDPLFQYALINLGATSLYAEDWTKASNNLQLAIKDGSHDGAEVLMLTEAVMHLYDQTKDKAQLDIAAKALYEFISKNIDYQLEARIALLYLNSIIGDKAKLYPNIDQILEMDFQLTENHRHTLFIHRDRTTWATVAQWCLKATQDLDPNSHVVSLESMCILKSGEVADASRKIDDALAQTPKDPLVLAVGAYVMSETNSADRAQVSIEKAVDIDHDGQSLQVLRQRARACKSKGDHDCERETLKRLLAKDPSGVQALADLSKIMMQDKNLSEAKRLYQQGVRTSENYRPFFALNKSISQAEDREKARGL